MLKSLGSTINSFRVLRQLNWIENTRNWNWIFHFSLSPLFRYRRRMRRFFFSSISARFLSEAYISNLNLKESWTRDAAIKSNHHNMILVFFSFTFRPNTFALLLRAHFALATQNLWACSAKRETLFNNSNVKVFVKHRTCLLPFTTCWCFSLKAFKACTFFFHLLTIRKHMKVIRRRIKNSNKAKFQPLNDIMKSFMFTAERVSEIQKIEQFPHFTATSWKHPLCSSQTFRVNRKLN